MNIWKESNLLREQASSRSAIHSNIGDSYHVRFEHLVKLFYYRDYSMYLRGWIASARKGIESIPLLKGSKGTVNPKTLYKWTFEDYTDNWDTLINGIINDINYSYDDLPKIKVFDTEELKNFCSDYFKEVSDILSKDKYFSSESATNLIEELLKKYPLEE